MDDELPQATKQLEELFSRFKKPSTNAGGKPAPPKKIVGAVNMTASSEIFDNSSNNGVGAAGAGNVEPEAHDNLHAPLERLESDADDPNLYEKFYNEHRPTVSSVNAVMKEGQEMRARHLNSTGALESGGVDEKDKITNVLGPNETSEDVLCKTSAIWRERFESAREYEKNVAGLVVRTAEYEKKYNSHRLKRLQECWSVIRKRDDPLLPSSVKQSGKWFDKLTATQQFPLLPTVYSNLTYFGNIMTHIANDFTVIANPGQNFETMMAIRVTCLAAPHFNIGQSLMALLAGDASVGKSYLMHCNKTMLPDGWAIVMSHLSTLGLSSDENDDFIVLMIEETPMTMTQETDGKSGQDNGASFLKTLLTNKIVTTRTVAFDKGERTRKVHVTSKMMTGVFATNGTLNSNSPLLKRYMVIKPGFDPEIAEKITKIKAADFEQENTNALLRQRVIAHYVQLTELMIGMGAIKGPDMDEFAIYMSKIVTEMKRCGHFMVDAKAVNMVQSVVRTLVVMRAVCEALLSEKNCDLRFDQGRNMHMKFDEHYLEHFTNIEKLLVAQEPEVVFGISMCANIFGDDTIGKMVEAAKHILNVKVVEPDADAVDGEGKKSKNPDNSYCKLEREIAFLPTKTNLVDNQKKISLDCLYGEIQPPQGRGLENVVDLMRSRCSEQPSVNNMTQALTKAMRMNLTHLPMYYKEGDDNKGELHFDKTQKKTENTLIKRVQLEDDLESSFTEPDEPNGSKNSKRTMSQKSFRYYFNIAGFVHYMPQREAMKKSLLKLQHIGTYDGVRHLICMPRVDKFTDRPNAKNHYFHGIFDHVDFSQDKDNVLFYHSQHTLLAVQLQTLSSSMMFDGGDPTLASLTKTQLEERERANKKRSIMAQTSHTAVTSNLDYDLFMKRHLDCAAVGEDNDITFWHNFVDFMLAKRASMTNTFGPYFTYEYPKDILRQAQMRNKNSVLISNDKIKPADKMAALGSFSSIVYGNAASLEPPSIYEIHKRLRQGKLEGLRNSFPRIDPALYKPLHLDAASKYFENERDWIVLRNIYTLYRNPEKLMETFLYYCGYSMEVVDTSQNDQRAKQQKTLRIIRTFEPDIDAIPKKTAFERLTTKRLSEQLDPTNKKPRINGSDESSQQQQQKSDDSDVQHAQQLPTESDKKIDNFNTMVLKDKQVTHRRLDIEGYKPFDGIDKLLNEHEPETAQKTATTTTTTTTTINNNNNNRTSTDSMQEDNSLNTTANPSYSTFVNPTTGTPKQRIFGRRQ